MSFTVLLAVLAIILVVLFVFAPSALAGLIDTSTGFYTATQLQPRVGVDEIICDLRVTVDADLVDSNIFFLIDTKPSVQINGINHQWFNCVASSELGFLDLVDTNHLQQNSLLDFLVVTPQEIKTSIKLIDSTDSSQQVSKALQPQLENSVKFGSGSVIDTPFNISKTYVVNDIPLRNYIIEAHFDDTGGLITGIGDMNLGQPFVTTIPNSN